MRVKNLFRVLRILSAVVLFFFLWTFGPIYAAVAWAAEKQKSSVNSQKSLAKDNLLTTHDLSSAERFEKALA